MVFPCYNRGYLYGTNTANIKLPNGLRVLEIPMDSVQSATVMIMVGAGSRYETRKNQRFIPFFGTYGIQRDNQAADRPGNIQPD